MGNKILAVDDEVLIQKTIERALSKVGYTVRTATDAVGFLSALNEEPADLLIVDLHLGGTDTDDMVRRAREISPDSRVLYISGSIPSRLGDPSFLEKPFKIDDLRARVRQLLEKNHEAADTQ